MTNQEFPESFTLELRARHFENTKFGNCENCVIAKSVKEMFSVESVTEGVFSVGIHAGNGPRYSHEYYGTRQFNNDLARAKRREFNDTIIRTIKMTRA